MKRIDFFDKVILHIFCRFI